jgi:3-dehydroquinate synthase
VPTPIAAIRTFLRDQDIAALNRPHVRATLDAVLGSAVFLPFLTSLVEAPVFAAEYGNAFAAAGASRAIAPCRMLRGSLNMPLQHFFALVGQVATAFEIESAAWRAFAESVHASTEWSAVRLSQYLVDRLPDAALRAHYRKFIERLIEEHPHAVYPTSNYRECDGFVETTDDHRSVEAVMTLRTFASIRIVDHVLDVEQHELRDIYRPLGRCICLVDQNVYALYGDKIERYFQAHGVDLELLVYRALESDKGLATVERMLGDFKRLGVSRNEPVLIVGGGVLADTGGLACALYGRSTPYVMLNTSIVSGIDAGPSPRTCCDAFGYKNLLGAYHPPVLCITDRFFFGTLHEGWLRHGAAEIIKIATVKNAELFDDLAAAQHGLVPTRFGTVGCEPGDEMVRLSQKILSGAMRSYIEAEYDNLYETHQCRPHAYGHTWSPGFEIEAGLLHGHAVAIDMGFGAYLSLQRGWIESGDFDRIVGLISGYGLSLWHEILDDEHVMWESHRKIIQKRGGNLVAPLPKGRIGRCGYLNELSRPEFFSALREYRSICASYPRAGRGIDALCSDVGLESAAALAPAELKTSAAV